MFPKKCAAEDNHIRTLKSYTQVNLMLSGFGTLLDHERDKVDSVKIFLSTLKLISLYNHENKITL